MKEEIRKSLDDLFEQKEKADKAIVKEARHHIIRTLLSLDYLDDDWKQGSVYNCAGGVQGMTDVGLIDYITGKIDDRFNGADVLEGIDQLKEEGIVGENVLPPNEQENAYAIYPKTVCYLLIMR